MNRTYRLVWNVAQQRLVTAPETASSGGRGGRGGCGAVLLCAKPWLAAMVAALAWPAWALPIDGQVVGGSGTVTQGASTLNVNQSSNSLALNWQSFNIGASETVNFIQPSSAAVALNRVTGPDPSAIFGRLNANGQVFLVNGSGILFGQGAQVNVGGLVASTLDLSTADFMAGRRSFGNSANGIAASSSARVENRGSLNAASGGYIALLGGQVSNQGTIRAQQGSVALAAGQRVKLDFAGDKLLSLQVEQGTLDALAENQQLIQADGGQVVMTAQAADQVLSGVVNNTGIVQARGISTQGGVIRLSGDAVVNTGTLDVSGPQGGSVAIDGRSVLQAGTVNADGVSAGGSVRVNASGALLQTALGTVSVNATQANASTGGSIALNAGAGAYLSGTLQANGNTGGLITASAGQLTLAAATVQADGQTQGGRLLLGGDAHGAANPALANATRTFISPTSTLSALGARGKIVVWADDTTNYFGSAKTGAQGFIEVSGKGTLNYGGQADASVGGNVLLDPTNLVIDASAPASFYLDLANPNPSSSTNYGATTQVLSNGNILVNADSDSFNGANTGAVFLFNGSNGALISSLFGSHNGDFSGSSFTLLASGNFVHKATSWDSGTVTNVGAVTWGSATAGVSGVLSSANALVGVANGDVSSATITTLTNGNYVLRNPSWDASTTATNAGAVTWGSGTAGVSGTISSANSLIGSKSSDSVGSTSLATLTNGNYVVISPLWANGTVSRAGAVTWGSATAGVSGVVASSNSLVGSRANDCVGSSGVLALSNGNYVVQSPLWDNGTATNAGAATWALGTVGVTGAVDSSNSLVGSKSSDSVGGTSTVIALGSDAYLVRTSSWDDGTTTGVGAVTWSSATTGITGTISASNSLIGSKAFDSIGSGGIVTLSNGNYLVLSPLWDDSTITQAGAVTWGSGTTGVSGTVSSSNSLIGSSVSDSVGASSSIVTLSNGNYLARSPVWDNGTVSNAGAVTWASGTAGVSGTISSSNSLVGSSASDSVGASGTVTALSNGNYVVRSSLWDNGTVVDAGAVTWGSGTSGVTGDVSSSNSLVGGFAADSIGSSGITLLTSGNYLIASPKWHSDTVVDAGAVTWVSGTAGFVGGGGVVSSSNSLVGSATGDSVGGSGITQLANGNYVVKSVKWQNGTVVDAGAVTWGSGTAGFVGGGGLVSSSNSLVGSATGDSVGGNGVTALTNGNYVVASNKWHSGTIVDAGAVTWGSGTAGVTGVVSSSNSLVGSATSDVIGSNGVTELASNGNYVVVSTIADMGTLTDAGAVTWGSGTAGISGVVSSANSLVGSSANDSLGSNGIAVLSNGNYVVRSSVWDNGTVSDAGAATWGSGTAGVTGTISSANSLIGSHSGDQVANGGLYTLSTGNYVVQSSNWDNGTVSDAGAVTWGSSTRALRGAFRQQLFCR